MKGLSLVVGITAALFAGARTASAQSAPAPYSRPGVPRITAQPASGTNRPLVRADLSGTIGWLNINKSEFESHNDWHGRSFFGGGGFGWYWTDHLKTEVQVGGNTEIRVYTSTPVVISNTRVFAPSNYTFSTRRVTVGQLYQFGRNQWFHPYLGAGVDIVWERTSRRDEFIYFYDQVTRQSRLLRNQLDHPVTIDMEPVAFGSAGFKGYVSRRTFFVLDGRMTFTNRLEEVLIRIGFGGDF